MDDNIVCIFVNTNDKNADALFSHTMLLSYEKVLFGDKSERCVFWCADFGWRTFLFHTKGGKTMEKSVSPANTTIKTHTFKEVTMTKKIIAILLALTMLLTLTSCMRTKSSIKYNADGTLDVTYLLAISTQAAESAGESAEDYLMDAETLALYEKNGCTITEYTEDGYHGYIINQKLDPTKPEDTENTEDGEDLEDMVVVDSRWFVEDGIAYFDYDGSSVGDTDSIAESADIIRALGGFAYITLELPIEPITSNATEVSEDGKVLTWDILTTTNVHAEYDFEKLTGSGAVITNYGTNPFEDVKRGTFYHDAVLWAYDWGITTGTSDTTFSPDATCTRGQVVTFLWRAFGEQEPLTTENPFTDVKESDYFYKAVLWAVDWGITTGTSATTFSPNTTCSNAHILTFIWRAFGEPGKTGEGEWYADAVNWASECGMLDGIFTEELDPSAECPRGVVVSFLYRAANSYYDYYEYDFEDWEEFENWEDFEGSGSEPEEESEPTTEDIAE